MHGLEDVVFENLSFSKYYDLQSGKAFENSWTPQAL